MMNEEDAWVWLKMKERKQGETCLYLLMINRYVFEMKLSRLILILSYHYLLIKISSLAHYPIFFILNDLTMMDVLLFLIIITLQQMDKQSLTSIILSHNKISNKESSSQSHQSYNKFQRDKGSLVREILCFHMDKFSQSHHTPQTTSPKVSHLTNFLVKKQRQTQITPQVHADSQDFKVIDLFLKENNSVMVQHGQTIKNKSFNESTMAISKMQRSSVSPHRTIRKTENFNPPKLPEISQNHYSDSLFTLTQNQSQLTYEDKNNQSLNSNSNQVKKVKIDLNHSKRAIQQIKINNQTSTQMKQIRKMNVSLDQVQQYDQFFDCLSSKQQSRNQQNREEVFNYLKNKINKSKQNKSQRTVRQKSIKNITNEGNSSNGSSLNSFHVMVQRQKQEVNLKGFTKVNHIVNQMVKTVAQKVDIKIDTNKKNKNNDHSISSLFFPNTTSHPSTVHKLDEQSNDKSQLLRHLQDLQQYSVTAQLFKKLETQPQHQRQEKILHKQIIIDLQDLKSEEHYPFQKIGIQSQQNVTNNDPLMPSFNIDPSIPNEQTKKESKNCQIKRIQIDIEASINEYLQQKQEKQVSEVNLDDLSNYESDESSYYQKKTMQQKKGKTKSRIVLKSINFNVNKGTKDNKIQSNHERQFIQGLKNDISQLKSKIQTSFISERQQSSTKKPQIHKDLFKQFECSNDRQGLSELKQYVNDLQTRMLIDAGRFKQKL